MASFTTSMPASEIMKTGGSAGSEIGPGGRQSKDEYRKMKELEEQRKSGTAPAMVDIETGQDINPHIPQFITQTPWYVTSKGPTLRHQRPHEERQIEWNSLNDWYKRGVSNKVGTKYRKGACENCGSTTHKLKDCFERPRKIGARWTGDDIAPDEYLQPKLKMTFDAKRDRWNGYDPATHQEVIEEFQKLEEVRKLVRAQKMKAESERREKNEEKVQDDDVTTVGENDKTEQEDHENTSKEDQNGEKNGQNCEKSPSPERQMQGPVEASESQQQTCVEIPQLSVVRGAHEDEDKYAEDADMAGVTVDMDSRTRITVRNLRIREDTAKYLYNLDPKAPYYDPKSRSMRENPFAGVPGKEYEAVKFSGENFIRYTGEVKDANEAQVFAWQARQKGIDVHALAEPTKLEALKREFAEQKDDFKDELKRTIIDKYGGEEHLQLPPRELLLAQTEHYVEYSRKGTLIKGAELPTVRSRYEEDVYRSNHTAIWGSYWKDGKWGYQCCHSVFKNAYCIGDVGRKQDEIVIVDPLAEKQVEMQEENSKAKRTEKMSCSDDSSSISSSSSESSEDEEQQREKEMEQRRRARNAKKRDNKRAKRLRRKERKAAEKVGEKPRKKTRHSSSDTSDEDSDSLAKLAGGDEKLKSALKRAEKQNREAEKALQLGERKRKYHSNYETKAPSEADMEAYRLTQIHSADPMAGYVDEKRRKKQHI